MGARRIASSAITAAIRVAGGNVSAAARALKCTNATLFRRLREDPSLWPAGVEPHGPGGGAGREPVIPGSAITEALRATDGNVLAAARILRVTPGAINARVKRDPGLWPDGARRRSRGQNGDLTDAEVTAALRASGGDVRRAAEALGIRNTSVEARLSRRPQVWPAEIPRAPRAPRAAARRRAPSLRSLGAALSIVLRATGGDIAAAARAIGVTRQALSARLKAHPELWPEDVPRRRRRTAQEPAQGDG